MCDKEESRATDSKNYYATPNQYNKHLRRYHQAEVFFKGLKATFFLDGVITIQGSSNTPHTIHNPVVVNSEILQFILQMESILRDYEGEHKAQKEEADNEHNRRVHEAMSNQRNRDVNG